MAKVATLKLRIDSREAKTAAGDLDKLGKASKGAEKEALSLTRAYQAVGRVFGTIGASLVAREVVQAADAYKNLTSRLQLVSKSTEDFAKAQTALFDIAQRTRSGLAQTSDLYGSLALSTESLGVSQDELLRVTESINKSFAISGASASDAAGAITQLGQAFASGVLRGDELNSVLERAPSLARSLAGGLGVTVGQLRALGAAGELTAEKVFRALQKSGDSIDAAFAKIPLTVEGATQQAATSLLRLIGVIDNATGATNVLAQSLSGISRGIDGLSNLPKTVQLGTLAKDLNTANTELKRLQALKVSPFSQLVPDLDKQLSAAQAKFDSARRKFNLADGNFGIRSPEDQSGAEARRLGIAPPTSTKGFVDTSTISGIQARIKDLKDLRDNAKAGSEEFKRLAGEIKQFEDRLKGLLPSRGGRDKSEQEVAPSFNLYKDQIDQSVSGLLEGSDVTQAKIFADTLKQLDDLYFDAGLNADLYESALKKLTGATSSAQDQASKFIDEQKRLAELLAGTESAGIDRQRQDLEILQKALASGAIRVEKYADAVRSQFGIVAEKTRDAKTFADELGLSFASAFEDAAVGGGKFSDVLKGLADDITRIIVRKKVTEPLVNAIGGPGGGGDFFSDLIGSIFGGFRAAGGPVSSGKSYIVGERGPELFTPGMSGAITPNNAIGGNVSVTIINQSGTQVQASATKRGTDPDGTQILEVVLSAVGDALQNRSGPVARGLEGGYGIRPTIL